jgi:hypothetical protein
MGLCCWRIIAVSYYNATSYSCSQRNVEGVNSWFYRAILAKVNVYCSHTKKRDCLRITSTS